jgi:hypothetical protein
LFIAIACVAVLMAYAVIPSLKAARFKQLITAGRHADAFAMLDASTRNGRYFQETYAFTADRVECSFNSLFVGDVLQCRRQGCIFLRKPDASDFLTRDRRMMILEITPFTIRAGGVPRIIVPPEPDDRSLWNRLMSLQVI